MGVENESESGSVFSFFCFFFCFKKIKIIITLLPSHSIYIRLIKFPVSVRRKRETYRNTKKKGPQNQHVSERRQKEKQKKEKTHMSEANTSPNPNLNLHDRTIRRVPEFMDHNRIPRD